MILELIHAGANQTRRTDVHTLWTESGLPIASDPTEQVTMGDVPPFEWSHDRTTLGQRMEWVNRDLAKPAARYMLDYEPKDTDWSGRDGNFNHKAVDIIALIARHARETHPDTKIGVYGYPANRWWSPYVTPDTYDAAERMLMRVKPDVFYVPIYLTHNAGEHDPDTGMVSPTLIERRVRAVIGACLMLAANLNMDTEIVPMLQTRLRHPGKAHNLRPVTPQTAAVWMGAVMGCGVERACVWLEYPSNDHRNPDVYVDDRMNEHRGAIPGLLTALGAAA